MPPGAETMQSLPLFAVMPVGIALLATGILYFLFLGRILIPEREELVPAGPTSYNFV